MRRLIILACLCLSTFAQSFSVIPSRKDRENPFYAERANAWQAHVDKSNSTPNRNKEVSDNLWAEWLAIEADINARERDWVLRRALDKAYAEHAAKSAAQSK